LGFEDNPNYEYIFCIINKELEKFEGETNYEKSLYDWQSIEFVVEPIFMLEEMKIKKLAEKRKEELKKIEERKKKEEEKIKEKNEEKNKELDKSNKMVNGKIVNNKVKNKNDDNKNNNNDKYLRKAFVKRKSQTKK
jgi:23S rRNA pseudoU1915 N3-methylase RlmH